MRPCHHVDVVCGGGDVIGNLEGGVSPPQNEDRLAFERSEVEVQVRVERS